MIVPVMAISNLVSTRQIYSEETNGAHANYREPVSHTSLVLMPLNQLALTRVSILITFMVNIYYYSFKIFPDSDWLKAHV